MKYIQRCKLLEIIDIDFLADISKAEDWDSFLYEMFDLLVSLEEMTEEFFIYNRDRLFFLKKKESMEIEIREAVDFLRDEGAAEFVIVVSQKQSREKSILIPRIINYLKGRQLGYQLLSETQKKILFPKDITEIISINR